MENAETTIFFLARDRLLLRFHINIQLKSMVFLPRTLRFRRDFSVSSKFPRACRIHP